MRDRPKTARCVLHHEGTFLLAVHSSFWTRSPRRWGLPGGNIEWREAPDAALRRELDEELYVRIETLEPLGSFDYKRRKHAVFGAESPTRLEDYDNMELLDIGWFSEAEVQDLAQRRRLHAGYELQAIHRYLKKIENT